MTNNGCWVLLCMMLAFAAPLGAEENESVTSISAAFSNGNSSEALAMVRQAFAKLKPNQSAEAKSLIQSILAFAPMDQSGQVIVAAIEVNPALGNVILSAISDTSEVEQLAILSRLSFAASRDPGSFSSVSESVPKMLNAVDGTVSMAERLSSPAYNPSNLLAETGVAISPHHPDIRADMRDLARDLRQLEADQERLRDARQEHKGAEVIKDLEDKVKDDRADIHKDRQDLNQDK